MKEIKDIAMWEGTDSELAKYTIGKLQEENKQLKEQLKYLRKNEYLNQVKWERNFNEYLVKELKTRLDKAIEYIEQFENIKAYYSWVEDGYEEYNYDEDFKKDLLDILRGKDEERKNRNTIKKSNL